MSRAELGLKVYFITKEGSMDIRLTRNLTDDIVKAAKALGAIYVVAALDWDMAADCPMWGVYDIRRAQNIGPRAQFSLPLPLKQFSQETSNAAVMYALAKLAGG